MGESVGVGLANKLQLGIDNFTREFEGVGFCKQVAIRKKANIYIANTMVVLPSWDSRD